jgi:hypothetical protein
VWIVGTKERYKDDECERSEYKGKNLAGQAGLFCFQGEYEG